MEKRNAHGMTEAEFLAAYNPGDYERPSVTVDMMVLRMKKDLSRLQILLIQRKDHPCIEQWALPGGFINMDESAYEAACRELEEETGLTNVYLEQIYTMSKPERDPRMRIIDIAYAALLPYGDNSEAVAGDDASEALWFDVYFNDGISKNGILQFYNEERNIRIEYELRPTTFINGRIKVENYVPHLVSKEALAFDHADIILEGLSRLRNKVMYTDIAFNLVPERFTLVDLQRVVEEILGKDLYKANFRDKIKAKVESLHVAKKPISSQRPAALYRYKE
jgi:ADP-ribose pyrophosphatase YjhB (NUDIX family)